MAPSVQDLDRGARGLSSDELDRRETDSLSVVRGVTEQAPVLYKADFEGLVKKSGLRKGGAVGRCCGHPRGKRPGPK